MTTPKSTDSPLIERFNVLNLLDPRSPTTAFQRTPIQVVTRKSETMETEQSQSLNNGEVDEKESVPELSFSEFPATAKEINLTTEEASGSSFLSAADDLDTDEEILRCEDPSPVVSDFASVSVDTTIEDAAINTPEVVVNAENVESELSTSFDYVSCEKSNTSIVPPLPSVVNSTKAAKKLFYTPNKKRNPLGPVENTCPVTPPSHYTVGSPQNVLRQKQWKRIQEERKKLGLEADENVPLPLYDVTASAPSKLTIRKARAHFINNL